jgi:hypothetical protein
VIERIASDGFDDFRDVIHMFPELDTLPSLEPEEEKGSQS